MLKSKSLSLRNAGKSPYKIKSSKGRSFKCTPAKIITYLIAFVLVVVLGIYIYFTDFLSASLNSVQIPKVVSPDLSAIFQNIVNEPVPVANVVVSEFVESSRRRRVAFAITITKDGLFLDGAAVLAYSIFDTFKDRDFDVSLVALVHPNVKSSRPVLKKLGFHVIEAPTPINVTAIKYPFLREKINKNGCCGASELIKLNSYRLMQYEWVIHMDADTLLLNPIDELFERKYSLIYTTDPNMATFKCAQCMPVQGGFLVLKPSVQDFRNIISTLMTTEFKIYHGWNKSHIGWFWGGMTVQGIMPYYYNKVTAPNRSQILDRCYYNTMADTENCSTQSVSELKSAHFTVCQKPWNCEKNHYNNLCKALHARWFELRSGAEAFYNISSPPELCRHGGRKWYKAMDLNNAIFPQYSKFRFDDSPDMLKPLEESGYITEDYDNTVGGHESALKAQQR